ncbi:hypothetical protein EDB92DRAFT_746312 [Lactarius akahatsu]|uniref:Fungal-type protein kinase domain-containing protein n=1 Tax=Lactarius akahatsu TaxID=416441 RepID=A0AAD4QD95_9AGAM|nr:hypothetical protein EDB92DRAFT_746312 [Lactarius akahatsu]
MQLPHRWNDRYVAIYCTLFGPRPYPRRVRQGTLPFMSIRLLDEWYLDRPTLHTVVDDLESFLWVLVWSLVHTFKALAKIPNKNSMIHRLGHILPSRNYADKEPLRKAS